MITWSISNIVFTLVKGVRLHKLFHFLLLKPNLAPLWPSLYFHSLWLCLKLGHASSDALLGECSKLIHFWATLAKFWPSSGHKMTENWWFPTIIVKSIHTIQCKLGVYTYWVSVQNWFALGANFGPLVATKWLKMVVSDHYLKKYSHNPIQTWCVLLLCECSELIRFWSTSKFWPSTGQKINENGHFCWGVHLLGERSEFGQILAL